MNNAIFNLPMTDPRLNYNMLQIIEGMFAASPENDMRQNAYLQLTPHDEIHFFTQNAVRPNCAIISTDFANLILLSGTSGLLHVEQLYNGWNDPGSAVYASGACRAFENAALDILAIHTPEMLGNTTHTRIFGHSYGGAVGEVMMDYLCNVRDFSNVQCASYGAPRPGTAVFQQRMERLSNTRWFTGDDPVRFIPPHLDEAPSAVLFAPAQLWRGMNQQVQCPSGWELQSDGRIVSTEGNPTRTHAVFTSVASWIADAGGFRSEEHSPRAYMNRLGAAIQSRFVVPPKVRSPRVEEPLTVRPRETAVFESEGEADVAADPTINLMPGTQIIVDQVRGPQRDRYKRRKRGRIWTVEFRGEVVAVGPGKRRAGQIAKRLNRSALMPA